MATYAGAAKQLGVVDFLMAIIPSTVIDAFTKGDILSIVFVSVFFGVVLARIGDKGKPVRDLVNSATKWVFGVINLMMWLARSAPSARWLSPSAATVWPRSGRSPS